MAFRHRFRREQEIAHCRSHRALAPGRARARTSPRKSLNSSRFHRGPAPSPTLAARGVGARDAPAAGTPRERRASRPHRRPRSRAPPSICAPGDLVAFPTETVYGLGADAGESRGGRRIFAAKGRPADHPVIVHLPDASHVSRWARACPTGARTLAAAFWPGPLTLILPRTARAADFVTGGQDSVGLRVPSHPVARALLAAFGDGIAAPSANRFGRISPTTAQHVADDLGDAVALILDGGACAVGIESTIVAFVGDAPVLLRPGGIAVARARARARAGPARARTSMRRARSGTLAVALRAADAGDAGRRPTRCAPSSRSSKERDEDVAVLARTVARPADFEDAWIRAPADAAGVRARPLREPARARRRERRRDPDRERCPTATRGSPCATGSRARRAARTTTGTEPRATATFSRLAAEDAIEERRDRGRRARFCRRSK